MAVWWAVVLALALAAPLASCEQRAMADGDDTMFLSRSFAQQDGDIASEGVTFRATTTTADATKNSLLSTIHALSEKHKAIHQEEVELRQRAIKLAPLPPSLLNKYPALAHAPVPEIPDIDPATLHTLTTDTPSPPKPQPANVIRTIPFQGQAPHHSHPIVATTHAELVQAQAVIQQAVAAPPARPLPHFAAESQSQDSIPPSQPLQSMQPMSPLQPVQPSQQPEKQETHTTMPLHAHPTQPAPIHHPAPLDLIEPQVMLADPPMTASMLEQTQHQLTQLRNQMLSLKDAIAQKKLIQKQRMQQEKQQERQQERQEERQQGSQANEHASPNETQQPPLVASHPVTSAQVAQPPRQRHSWAT